MELCCGKSAVVSPADGMSVEARTIILFAPEVASVAYLLIILFLFCRITFLQNIIPLLAWEI